MRVLITSAYSEMGREPTIAIADESSFPRPLEAMQQEMVADMAKHDIFLAFTIFEVPDGTDTAAYTLQAAEVRDRQRERYMATLYFHAVQSFQVLKDGAVYCPQDPMPLSAEDIATVFEQLKARPDFRGHRLVGVSEDVKIVES